MYNICVLRHSKIVMFLTYIIGYFFSLSLICPCMICSKRKYAKNIYKSKKNQNAFKYGCKRISRRCGSYRIYLDSDSPHQVVMIVCELKLIFFHISNRHNTHILCYFWYMCRYKCDLAITRDTCVNVCSLNYLSSFWNIKIG